jgi:hypothetical protein
MVEARDIDLATQAELLRTNLVTGLQSVYKSAFVAERLRVLEQGQHDAVVTRTVLTHTVSYTINGLPPTAQWGWQLCRL